MLVEDRHPTEDLMGIYDPTGGLQRIVIFRETHPDRDEVKQDRAPRDRALLRRGEARSKGGASGRDATGRP